MCQWVHYFSRVKALEIDVEARADLLLDHGRCYASA